MTERNTYARAPRGRINHLITGDNTACGVSLTGMAKWPTSLMPRVDARPLCSSCRAAKPAQRRPVTSPEERRENALALLEVAFGIPSAHVPGAYR